MSKKESPVKASELIEELQDGPIEAEIVDEGDLEPSFWGVKVDVGDDHVCTVTGKYMYKTADCCHGINYRFYSSRIEMVCFGIIICRNCNNDQIGFPISFFRICCCKKAQRT